MVGALCFSMLCTVAALAAERGLRALRMPTRMPWAAALTIGACWPVIAPFILTPAPQASLMRTPAGNPAPLATPFTSENIPAIPTMFAGWYERLDPTLLMLWSVTSALLFIQVALALRTLHRVRLRARVAQVNGEHVLVDEWLGPAVIGLVNPAIVIPSWLFGFDDTLRALVLRHEREHCRARDPGLVWLAVAATTLLPWNLSLWWIAQRLRVAMEIDCDARTLHGNRDHTTYARLLMLIAQHHASARFAPLLSNSSSHLRRRISAMQTSPVRYPRLRAAIALVVTTLAVAGACSGRMASNLTSPTPVAASSSTPAVSATIDQPTPVTPPFFDFQVDTPAAVASGSVFPRYPAAQRAAGVAGTVLAQFVVNADGTIDTASFKVLRSTHADFSLAVRGALNTIRFTAARKGGTAVKQVVQQPFAFETTDSEGISMATRRPEAVTSQRPSEIVSASAVQTPAQINEATFARKPYFEFQVDQPARVRPGAVGPRYPLSLRDASVQGQVLVQFVVDTAGRVDLSTVKVLKSDHELFSDAVNTALTDMQFEPAKLRGGRVMQLVQMPFQFSLNRD